jgi:hypothetical protein
MGDRRLKVGWAKPQPKQHGDGEVDDLPHFFDAGYIQKARDSI